MRLQPEPWPLCSVPTGVLGQLSLFAPVLLAFLPSTSGYLETCLGLGHPFPHAQGQARYSMDTLDPAAVGAGAPAPSPPATLWLSLYALPPLVFLVLTVFIRWS